jgi:hypothetical protein
MRKKTITMAMLLFSTIAARGDEKESACRDATITDYNTANLALMQKGTPAMPFEATIAQRRLEEEFCSYLVRCALTDPSSLQFKSAFDSCLRNEALKKYDAVERERSPAKKIRGVPPHRRKN